MGREALLARSVHNGEHDRAFADTYADRWHSAGPCDEVTGTCGQGVFSARVVREACQYIEGWAWCVWDN
jgi:hypothetical protein